MTQNDTRISTNAYLSGVFPAFVTAWTGIAPQRTCPMSGKAGKMNIVRATRRIALTLKRTTGTAPKLPPELGDVLFLFGDHLQDGGLALAVRREAALNRGGYVVRRLYLLPVCSQSLSDHGILAR